jgi:hypothetical protein
VSDLVDHPDSRTDTDAGNFMVVSNEGELELEVDMEKHVSDEDRAKAAEIKVKANKAFAGEFGRQCRRAAYTETRS